MNDEDVIKELSKLEMIGDIYHDSHGKLVSFDIKDQTITLWYGRIENVDDLLYVVTARYKEALFYKISSLSDEIDCIREDINSFKLK